MWKVLDKDNFVRGKAKTLDIAMEMAKYIDEFVTITNGITEFVGMFGVDSIEKGVCPDGIEYTWMKRRNS